MNSVTVIGRLTKNPEVRKTQTGFSVSTITLAVDREHEKDKTDFIPVVVWRQSADYLGRYAHKGDVIAAKGIVTSRQTERNGYKSTVIEVVAERVELLHKATQSYNETKHADTEWDEFEEQYQQAEPEREDLPF